MTTSAKLAVKPENFNPAILRISRKHIITEKFKYQSAKIKNYSVSSFFYPVLDFSLRLPLP